MKISKAINLAVGIVCASSIVACSDNNGPILHPGPPTQIPTSSPVSPPLNTTQTYTQIERLSRPAIKEAFESFQEHQTSNAAEPYNDPTIKAAIMTTEDAVRPANSAKNTDYGATLATVLYPDEYLVNLNGAAPSSGAADPELFLSAEVDGSSAFGGRQPNDDVIGLELGVLFGSTLHAAVSAVPDDGEENNCLQTQNIASGTVPAKSQTTTFPYLPAPQ